MNIPMNDGKVDSTRERIANQLVTEILKGFEKESLVRIYLYHTPYREDICRYVGREFRKQGYYVALTFVPNGCQSFIVSKTEIPNPTGRLVCMERL